MVIIWVGKYYIEWLQVQVNYVFAVNELESSNYLFDEDLTFFFCETVFITCSSKQSLLCTDNKHQYSICLPRD